MISWFVDLPHFDNIFTSCNRPDLRFGAFSGKCMGGMVWIVACWCILATFSIDQIMVFVCCSSSLFSRPPLGSMPVIGLLWLKGAAAIRCLYLLVGINYFIRMSACKLPHGLMLIVLKYNSIVWLPHDNIAGNAYKSNHQTHLEITYLSSKA